MMTALEGFKPFDYSVGVASASVTSNGVTFNRAVVHKLGKPAYVVLLINTERKQIAIQVCEEGTPLAIDFFKERKEGEAPRSVRWNSRDLRNTLVEMMDWDLGKTSYRIEGRLVAEEKAMIFDLTQATELGWD